MQNDQPHIKIADFGCAVVVNSVEASWHVPGCKPYLSPERITTGIATLSGNKLLPHTRSLTFTLSHSPLH